MRQRLNNFCKNENIIACFSIAFLFASDLTNVPFSLDMKFRWCWHCSRRRRFWHFKFGQTWILRSRAGPESHRRRQSSHHNGKETGKQQTYERSPSWTDYFMTRHGLDSTKAIKRTWKRKNSIAVFRGSFCCFTRADNCILLLCDADVTRVGHNSRFRCMHDNIHFCRMRLFPWQPVFYTINKTMLHSRVTLPVTCGFHCKQKRLITL